MSRRLKYLSSYLLLLGGLVLLNLWAGSWNVSWDLTEDNRYTLSEKTVNMIRELDQPVEVTLLLNDPLPADFKRLRQAAANMLKQFHRINEQIDFQYIDPTEGSVEEVNQMKEELSRAGILPVTIRLREEGEMTEKLAYPYAVFAMGERQFAASLLEDEGIDLRGQTQLNNSISLLEYKFVSALDKLTAEMGRLIGFTTGHGELGAAQTADIRQSLAPLYQSGQLLLDSVDAIPMELDLVIVARPTGPFSERDKYLLDQYIMKGGRVIFALDRLAVNLDSVARNESYVPHEYPLNLDDLLFKYGLRLRSGLVQDLECSRIPLAIGRQGDRDQIELFKWYYYPLAMTGENHPVSKNLDRVNLLFANPVDTLKTALPARKHILLTSSPYARVQGMPNVVDFNILRYPPETEEFDRPHIPLGVLVEGSLESVYANRPAPDGLDEVETVRQSDSAAIMLFSDGDLLANQIDPQTGEPLPLGFDRFDQQQYANKAFVLNAVEYFMDRENIIQLRNRDFELRLLDRLKAREEALKWRMLNIGLPFAALAFFGIIFHLVRRRKYAMRYEHTTP